jgi:hypothetical protein
LDTDPEDDCMFHYYLQILQPRIQLSFDTIRFTRGGMRIHVVGESIQGGELIQLEEVHFPMNFHTIFFDDVDLGMDSILGIVRCSEDNPIVLR